ncbi:MAG: hypothetical protein JJU36_14700 [Phycisphaeraceae bacterium]|nr:hypothetical protein [Phycisphaeraceae bacterium]
MNRITINREERRDRCWVFDAQVEADGRAYPLTITLNWAEYNLWCPGGGASPQRVVQVLLEFLLEREPASAILPRFDCSVVRRYFPEVDQVMPGRIGLGT